MKPEIIADLDPEQKRAATASGGRIRVRAGAGTGKTRTLATRIAWLISQGVAPDGIMAVTFTNKAAREITERVVGVVGPAGFRVRIGTFHSLSCRILRSEEHTSELQSLMRISYAVFCLKKKNNHMKQTRK